MQLVFIYGAPAVGKLTIARELAKLIGFRLFHNHLTVDLVGAVFDFGSEPFVRLREEIWLATFREAAVHGVSLIFTFAPEATVTPAFVNKAIEVVESKNGRVVFVQLTCEESELEHRLEDPSRNEFEKLKSVSHYRTLRDSGVFQYPVVPSDLTLDTTAVSPAATARSIASFLTATGA